VLHPPLPTFERYADAFDLETGTGSIEIWIGVFSKA
jgi:predicted transcriptional regulator YdeE